MPVFIINSVQGPDCMQMYAWFKEELVGHDKKSLYHSISHEWFEMERETFNSKYLSSQNCEGERVIFQSMLMVEDTEWKLSIKTKSLKITK